MAKVRLLSRETAELIAAGEVIERPCSVIKELIENSIDSGADNITIEIKNGGISFIRVTDNGCGIDFDDVPTAFLRHATSKISDKDDLDNINTLGFRGEALASICAVAKVEVLTKTKGEIFGSHYVIEGTEEKVYEQSGCPEGTTIIIRDIFYNVPARLKFLKKDIAEGNAIADIVSKIAISHPEISFKFIRNNKQDFMTPGDGELYSSVYSVMGREFAESMIPIKYELNGITIKGFTVKPLKGRPKRNFQYFFVNGRYVKTYTCVSALEEAYQNSIMEGKFPACVILLEVSPNMLDVNVHPAKIEVRFTDDRLIHDAVFFSVKNALLSDSAPAEIKITKPAADYTKTLPESYNIGKQMIFSDKESSVIKISEVASVTACGESDKIEKAVANKQPQSTPAYKTLSVSEQLTAPVQDTVVNDTKVNVEYNDNHAEKYQTQIPYVIPEKDMEESLEKFTPAEVKAEKEYKYISANKETVQQPIIEKPDKEIFFRIIGEAFKNYIITEVDNEIIFVDKHAAHERILFEKLKSGEQQLQCQMLLIPVEVMLSNDEYNALIANKKTAEDLGFSFSESNGFSVIVNGVPAILGHCDAADLIVELANNFSINKNNPMPVILDDMYHTFACKAAIKANDKNDIKELSEIVKTLIENENIRYCPHGRPVMFKLTKYELEKQFKRIV